MAKSSPSSNGHSRLEEAMTLLIQNQAAFVSQIAESNKLHAKLERETAEQFAQVRQDMAAILRVLAEHGRMLERLPEAVREKIGFKPTQQVRRPIGALSPQTTAATSRPPTPRGSWNRHRNSTPSRFANGFFALAR